MSALFTLTLNTNSIITLHRQMETHIEKCFDKFRQSISHENMGVKQIPSFSSPFERPVAIGIDEPGGEIQLDLSECINTLGFLTNMAIMRQKIIEDSITFEGFKKHCRGMDFVRNELNPLYQQTIRINKLRKDQDIEVTINNTFLDRYDNSQTLIESYSVKDAINWLTKSASTFETTELMEIKNPYAMMIYRMFDKCIRDFDATKSVSDNFDTLFKRSEGCNLAQFNIREAKEMFDVITNELDISCY